MLRSCTKHIRRYFTSSAASYPSRTHNCGALRAEHANASVVLAGWILPQRKISNSLSFFSLKDACGTTQLVANRSSERSARTLDALAAISVESILLVKGNVRLRPQNARRSADSTGDIEVLVDDFSLINPADHSLMPFIPSDSSSIPNEELRSRFRHLDLRRPGSRLAANLRKRSDAALSIRNYLHSEDFVEVETPLLLKSTPEGAREFLVPTRVGQSSSSMLDSLSVQEFHPSDSGEKSMPNPLFYTLPQSPQQPKQLLVTSGAVERYYQFAKCFRDEDGRRDRQPEFTQIDLEMAFVDWGHDDKSGSEATLFKSAPGCWRIGGHDVRRITEGLVQRVWKNFAKVELPQHFPVMTYKDAMQRFGSDKPDTRLGLEIKDVTSLLPSLVRASLNGYSLDCLAVHTQDNPAAEQHEFLTASQRFDLQFSDGVVRSIIRDEDNLQSWFSESLVGQKIGSTNAFVSGDFSIDELNRTLNLSVGDTVFVAWRKKDFAGAGSTELGRVRSGIADLAEQLGTYVPPSTPHFLWVTEFPLFTPVYAEQGPQRSQSAETLQWSSTHHPFTAPMLADVSDLFAGNYSKVRGQHYDLVLNGVEIGGGSVRVHDANMQEHIFSQALKLSDSQKSTFDHLLHALRCGAPPHGGIALGFDRLMAILCGTHTIRDVIAFPKTGTGTDTFFKSPSSIPDSVLAQYGIRSR